MRTDPERSYYFNAGTEPLQGVFNFIVYLYPRFRAKKERRRREIAAAMKRQELLEQQEQRQSNTGVAHAECHIECKDNRQQEQAITEIKGQQLNIAKAMAPSAVERLNVHGHYGGHGHSFRDEMKLNLQCIKSTLMPHSRNEVDRNDYRLGCEPGTTSAYKSSINSNCNDHIEADVDAHASAFSQQLEEESPLNDEEDFIAEN